MKDFYKAVQGDLLTIEKIAKKLNVGKAMAYLHTRKKDFPMPAVVISRRKFWAVADVEEWINAHR